MLTKSIKVEEQTESGEQSYKISKLASGFGLTTIVSQYRLVQLFVFVTSKQTLNSPNELNVWLIISSVDVILLSSKSHNHWSINALAPSDKSSNNTSFASQSLSTEKYGVGKG